MLKIFFNWLKPSLKKIETDISMHDFYITNKDLYIGQYFPNNDFKQFLLFFVKKL